MFPKLYTEEKRCELCKFYSETTEGTPICYRYPDEIQLKHDGFTFKIEPEIFCGEFRSRRLDKTEN